MKPRAKGRTISADDTERPSRFSTCRRINGPIGPAHWDRGPTYVCLIRSSAAYNHGANAGATFLPATPTWVA